MLRKNNESSRMMFDRIIAFTGAGISKASGIPTFEERGDIKKQLTLDNYRNNIEAFESMFSELKDSMRHKNPNDAHKALAEYGIPIITMNIDGLHTKAGSKIVYEVHGNIFDHNVVLYGEEMHYYYEALNAIQVLNRFHNDRTCLLIIGTSMQTEFANEIYTEAIRIGTYIKEINDDAEHKVREFLEAHAHMEHRPGH